MSRLKKYLPELIYGGVDGTVTTFAIVAGTVGASLSPSIILILGFANVLADGFSMAASNYLSHESEIELGDHSQSKDTPWKTSIATFISFVLIGLIPLFPFTLEMFGVDMQGKAFLTSCIFTGAAFLIVGFGRGVITGKNHIKSALTTLFIGGVAASISYIVGALLKGLA